MRKILKLLMILFFLTLSSITAYAHPGNLQKASKVECNGKIYGYHKESVSGEIHWHEGKINSKGQLTSVGLPLGLTNPCETTQPIDENKTTTPTETTPTEITPTETTNQESEAERKLRIANEAKVEKARLDKINKDEEKRIVLEEQERLEKEKKEADLAKKLEDDSSIEYLSVTIDDYNYQKSQMAGKDIFIVHNSLVVLEVRFKHESANFTYKQDKELDYFNRGIIDLQLTSFNEVNTEIKQLDILRIPTQNDIYTLKKFSILIDDNIHNISEQRLKLPYYSLEEMEIEKFKFAYIDKEIPLDYNIVIKKNDESEDILLIKLVDNEKEYEVPIKLETNTSYFMFPTILILMGFATIFYKKKSSTNIKNKVTPFYKKISSINIKNKVISPIIRTKSQKLVSVVIPSYESSDLIINTIESVLNQSHNNLEVIIVADKSKDNTIAELRKISRRDKRIKLLDKAKSKGIVDLRDVGINTAKADHVAFIQEGDEWAKDKIEKQLDFMLNNKAYFTYSDYTILESGSEEILKEILTPNKITLEFLPDDEVISWSSIMLNKKKIGKIDVPFLKRKNEEAHWTIALKKVGSGYRVPGINFKRYQNAALLKRLKSKIFK